MAGLIPQYFIDDILARTDIVEVIDARVPLKKVILNNVVFCKNPSVKIRLITTATALCARHGHCGRTEHTHYDEVICLTSSLVSAERNT